MSLICLDKVCPKSELLRSTGMMLKKKGYELKYFNTLDFKNSMHYNPFEYTHSEKDILELVTALTANTKGEGEVGTAALHVADRIYPLCLPHGGADFHDSSGYAEF